MTLSTQFGSPISSRRAVCATVGGVLSFALVKGSGKTTFDSVMIGAFVAGFVSCIPLDFPPLQDAVKL